jgi:hypothetical protein
MSPLPLCPTDRFKLTLKVDEPLDEEKRRQFWFYHQSGREQRVTAKLLDELEAVAKPTAPDAEASTVAYIDKVFEVLKSLVIDWTNVTRRNPEGGEPIAVPFDLEAVEDVMGYREAQTLIYAAWGYAPTAEDLGFCDSQSSTDGDESAKTEPAEDA